MTVLYKTRTEGLTNDPGSQNPDVHEVILAVHLAEAILPVRPARMERLYPWSTRLT